MMYICTVAESIAYGIEGASQEDVEEVIICGCARVPFVYESSVYI